MCNKIFSLGDKVKVIDNIIPDAVSYEGSTGVVVDVKVNEEGNTLYNVYLNEYNYALCFLGVELELELI